MTRLGIVVALAAESRTLGLRGVPCKSMTTPNGDVLVCISGIGAENARLASQRVLAQGANSLLSWGTAVALDTSLSAGQLLLPCQVLQADLTPLPTSSAWHKQLRDRLRLRFPVNEQPLISTECVLTHPADKQRLFVESAAVAADMESSAIAEVARDMDVPFAILRVIADTVTTRIPLWTSDIINEWGQLRYGRSLRQLLAHPTDWLSIFGLARDFRTALNTLSAVQQSGGLAQLNPGNTDN